MTTASPDTSKPKASLGKRSLQAGGWNLLATFATYALRLISNLIMTRLLLPDAFGMLAMAVVVLTALNMLTDIGIIRSVVREKDGGDTHFLRVAWVVKFARSAVIALLVLVAAFVLWIAAPHYAPEGSIYARPEMPGLIALAALSPLLAGLSSTSIELADRNMNYKRITFFTIASQIISTLSMILFAQFSATVWALMAGMLTANLLLCIFSHTLLPGPRMRFEWDREISDRLWNFGKWILASSTLGFVANNADKLILGGLLGPTTFGIFVIAQIWVEAGKQFITMMSNRIGFPAIAEVYRDRPDDVPRLYRKFQTAIDGICLLGFVTLLLGGPFLIELLYSETYHVAGRYLQLMSLSFLVVRFNSLTGLLLNTGNSRALLVTTAIISVSVCAGVPLGFSLLGIDGAIIGATVAPIAAVPYTLFHSSKILGTKQSAFDALWAIATLILTIIVLVVT